MRAFDRREFDGNAHAENADVRGADQRQHCIRLRIGDREFDSHRHVAGKFIEMLFAHHAVAAEARDRTDRRTSGDTDATRAFEQLFIQ